VRRCVYRHWQARATQRTTTARRPTCTLCAHAARYLVQRYRERMDGSTSAPTANAAPESPEDALNGSQSRRSSVQAVARAATILNALRDSPTPMTVLQLSAATSLDRTVTHRLAKSLAAEGLVLDERGTYRLGPATVLLSNRYIDDLLVRRLALPYMVEISGNELADKPWTVTLSIPVGALSTVIERIWTPQTPLDLVLGVGDNFPIDSSATGRSILSMSSDRDIVELLGEERAEKIHPILEKVREAGGVGVSRGEAVPGVQAIAAAISSRRATPVAGLGVSGVDLGEQLAYDSPLAATLRRAASAIGRMIT